MHASWLCLCSGLQAEPHLHLHPGIQHMTAKVRHSIAHTCHRQTHIRSVGLWNQAPIPQTRARFSSVCNVIAQWQHERWLGMCSSCPSYGQHRDVSSNNTVGRSNPYCKRFHIFAASWSAAHRIHYTGTHLSRCPTLWQRDNGAIVQ